MGGQIDTRDSYSIDTMLCAPCSFHHCQEISNLERGRKTAFLPALVVQLNLAVASPKSLLCCFYIVFGISQKPKTLSRMVDSGPVAFGYIPPICVEDQKNTKNH
jgi:hypothetical protein